MAGNIYHSWNGTVLTITSDSGTSSANLKGDDGARGAQGVAGGTCYEVCVAARNEFDNSDFSEERFISQAGLNAKHGNVPYVGDRWIGHVSITAEQKPNGVLLTSTSQFAYMRQIVKLKKGQRYTAAFKTSNGTNNQRIGIFNYGLTEMFGEITGNSEVICCSFTAAYNDMAILFYPSFTDGGGSSVLEWAALYEGDYTAQTLPVYQYKGFAAELMECQRYFERKYIHLLTIDAKTMYLTASFMSKRVYPTITIAMESSDNVVQGNTAIWNIKGTSVSGIIGNTANPEAQAHWYGYLDISADL